MSRAVLLSRSMIQIVGDDHVQYSIAKEFHAFVGDGAHILLVSRMSEGFHEEELAMKGVAQHALYINNFGWKVVGLLYPRQQLFDTGRKWIPLHPEIKELHALVPKIKATLDIRGSNEGLHHVGQDFTSEVSE